MPKAGDRLRLANGRYQLENLIGTSSFGEVWAARTFFGKKVAVKFVRSDTMDQAAPDERQCWLQGLRKESEFLKQLSRKETQHIVRPLDAGDWQGMPVLVMERMACNLFEHILALRREGRRPPLPLIVEWLGQINAALAAIHRHGWRYLDLKPGNLLLSADGKTLKVADFGTNQSRREATGHTFAGTIGWQAPEQFIPAGKNESGYVYRTDHRADYFALGLVFYFLVTGGEVLRYACDCQKIFREEGEEGARRFREGPGTTITEEERAQFLRCLGAEEEDATWRPAGNTVSTSSKTSRSPARLALTLLDSLLAATPGDRPANGGVIERRLSAIRQALEKPARIQKKQTPPNSQRWKWGWALSVVIGAAIWFAWNDNTVQAVVEQIATSIRPLPASLPESLPASRPLIYSVKNQGTDPHQPKLISPIGSP